MIIQQVARILLLAFVLLVAIAISEHIIFNQAPISQAVDFGVFERASKDPADQVYRDHPAPFAYPPTALLLMKPFTALGYWFWIAASALVFGLSTLILSGRKVATISFLSPAAAKGLVHGQSSMLLAAMLLMGLSLPPLLGGCLWGVAATVKPQLMIFAPLALLVRGDWQAAAGMVLGSALMVVGSLAFLEPSLWPQWIKAIREFNQLIEGGLMVHAVNPAGVAAAAGLSTFPFIIAGLALGTIAIVAAAPKVEGVQLVALVTAASLVASPYAHVYDTIALIPACVVLLFKGRWIYAVPAGLIFMGTPIAAASAMAFTLIVVSIEARLGITIELPKFERRPSVG